MSVTILHNRDCFCCMSVTTLHNRDCFSIEPYLSGLVGVNPIYLV
jgi:hypothetical protein